MTEDFNDVRSFDDSVPEVDNSLDFSGEEIEAENMEDDLPSDQNIESPSDDIPEEDLEIPESEDDDTHLRQPTVTGTIEGETTPETGPETREWRPRYY